MTVVVNNNAPGGAPQGTQAPKPPEPAAGSPPNGAGANASKVGVNPTGQEAQAAPPPAQPGKASEPAASTAPKAGEPAKPGAQHGTAPGRDNGSADAAPRKRDATAKPDKAEKVDKPKVPFMERVPEHVAAMLCYLLGWVSGIGFLLADRRPFVRFHAAQSVAVFGGLSVIWLVLSDFLLASFFPDAGDGLLVARRVVELVWIVATLVLMLKANSGQRFHVAFAGNFAERAAEEGK